MFALSFCPPIVSGGTQIQLIAEPQTLANSLICWGFLDLDEHIGVFDWSLASHKMMLFRKYSLAIHLLFDSSAIPSF